jgi:NADH-quinone oxidoreductase subunit N
MFTAMLLSLAGIPLTAGFIGKFYLVAAGISEHQWLLVVMLAVNSAIGLYYYIKIIAAMAERTEREEHVANELRPSVYVVSSITIAILTILLIWIGVHPNGMIVLIEQFVTLK